MNKKIIGIFICTLFIGTNLSVMGLTEKNQVQQINNYNKSGNGEELDQYQNISNYVRCSYDGPEWYAQSFQPTKSITSKIEIFVGKINYPNNLIVGIKYDLYGEVIVSSSIHPYYIPITPGWIEVDIPDVYTPVNKECFIVVTEEGSSPGNCTYQIFGSNVNSYDFGSSYYSHDEGKTWEYKPGDLAFKTYVCGMDNPPNQPLIIGPTSERPGVEIFYKFNAVDPDGDNVRYFIDWGDGTGIETTFFNPSDIDMMVSHKWNWRNTYIINVTAMDIYGAESDKSTMYVSISRDRTISTNELGNVKTGFIIGPYESSSWDGDQLVLTAGFQPSPARSLNYIVPFRRGYLHYDEQIKLAQSNNCNFIKNYIIGFCKIYMPQADISMHILSQNDQENQVTWVVDGIYGDKVWEENIDIKVNGHNGWIQYGPLRNEYLSVGDQIDIKTEFDGYYNVKFTESISGDILFESPLVKY